MTDTRLITLPEYGLKNVLYTMVSCVYIYILYKYVKTYICAEYAREIDNIFRMYVVSSF